MIILEKEVRLTPENQKTNITFPFTLDCSAEKLLITYSYSPKILDDREKSIRLIERWTKDDTEKYLPLKNLVTLSLDSPDGFRGSAHRHAPEQKHIISESFSSNGFLKTKIKKGDWRISLNVHAVVTEYCDCKLKIEVEG